MRFRYLTKQDRFIRTCLKLSRVKGKEIFHHCRLLWEAALVTMLAFVVCTEELGTSPGGAAFFSTLFDGFGHLSWEFQFGIIGIWCASLFSLICILPKLAVLGHLTRRVSIYLKKRNQRNHHR